MVPFGLLALAAAKKAGAHIFKADTVFEQRPRIHFDPHRWRRGTTDGDLADAADLRQLLLKDIAGGVIQLTSGQRSSTSLPG